MNEIITCPKCGKEIGTYVLHNVMHVKGIGAVPCYDEKYDYRKTSHIGFGRGLICKKCARQFFPEGIAYKVTVAYGRGRITPYIGIEKRSLFQTKCEAEEAVKYMLLRSRDNDPRIEEIMI